MSTAKNESPQLKYTGVEINFVINNLEAERRGIKPSARIKILSIYTFQTLPIYNAISIEAAMSTANIAYHIIITSMFSFMLYIKENKITDKEDFFSRKTTYYQTVILPGILSEKYYKQKYSKNAIKSEIIL